jgi:N-acetylneuraminate synthase
VQRKSQAERVDAVLIVAEIGCNHEGSLATARSQLRLAAEAGADVVKFQKRNVDEHLDAERLSAPYTGRNSFGATYREHRQRLELSLDDHAVLRADAAELGVGYACSVWDESSAREMATLDPAYLKIPSAANTDPGLLATVLDVWGGEIHVSLGMTTRAELRSICDVLAPAMSRTVLYACTSAYPVAPEDLSLLEISWLRTLDPAPALVGFSGHHSGIVPDVAAVALGAGIIERHVTDDRGRRGSDQALSLLADELATLRENVDMVAAGLRTRPAGLLACELPARSKLKYRSSQRVCAPANG